MGQEITTRPAHRPSRLQRTIVFFFNVAWLGVVAFGISRLWCYAATAGDSGVPRRQWPRDSRLQPTPGQANLVMLVHPRCPCTRASLAELAAIIECCQGGVAAHIVYIPADRLGDEQEADWIHAARAIPGVEVLTDSGGVETRRFGGRTSGQVLLYDRASRLVFSGGITGLRGHEGDNVRRQAALAQLTRGSELITTEVYGCPLFTPGSPADAEN